MKWAGLSKRSGTGGNSTNFVLCQVNSDVLFHTSWCFRILQWRDTPFLVCLDNNVEEFSSFRQNYLLTWFVSSEGDVRAADFTSRYLCIFTKYRVLFLPPPHKSDMLTVGLPYLIHHHKTCSYSLMALHQPVGQQFDHGVQLTLRDGHQLYIIHTKQGVKLFCIYLECFRKSR
jgi:hypothetical protein